MFRESTSEHCELRYYVLVLRLLAFFVNGFVNNFNFARLKRRYSVKCLREEKPNASLIYLGLSTQRYLSLLVNCKLGVGD